MPHPDPSAWLAAARHRLETAPLGPLVESSGTVRETADDIALVTGLPQVRLDELVRFAGGGFGFVHSLEPGHFACVLLDKGAGIEAGQAVFPTGEVVRVPVGPAVLGRVLDPLGRPLDGKGPVVPSGFEPVERPAPPIPERDLVTEPVQTGILVIDTLFPIGRGQRELLIGDHATGKTSLALDTILNQKHSDIVCVYVAVGQKNTDVKRVIEAIERHGEPRRTLVVVAPPTASPGLQWIAPFAGFTMAEWFRDHGGHALVVIDDLTKHAACHREIALLTHQPPGREAYPGDIFYVHARLLERAAKLAPSAGGGSLTALPIAETDAGNLTAYIPTNLISITDGQIVLDAKLFNQGQKPAVDVGTSVSRVGGKTQTRALRQAAGSLRLDYAQFLELEIFSRFGATPDERVRERLERGARLRAILTQPPLRPLRLAEEVALVLAAQNGKLDALPLPRLPLFRRRLLPTLETLAPAALARIEREGTLDEATTMQVLHAIELLAEQVSALSAP